MDTPTYTKPVCDHCHAHTTTYVCARKDQPTLYLCTPCKARWQHTRPTWQRIESPEAARREDEDE